MTNSNWQVSGDYFETCNCDYLCPCITSSLTEPPTKGYCDVAMIFHVEQGHYDNVTLDGLNVAVIAHTPDTMGKGDWSVGLITDERATSEQQQALVAIASGQAGGPMSALAGLIGNFMGVESGPIHFKKTNMSRSVSIPGVLDQAVEGVAGAANPNEPLYVDNTLHPANSRLALAKAVQSHLHAFGIDWDEDGGRNNGHFAPFSWQSA